MIIQTTPTFPNTQTIQPTTPKPNNLTTLKPYNLKTSKPYFQVVTGVL